MVFKVKSCASSQDVLEVDVPYDVYAFSRWNKEEDYSPVLGARGPIGLFCLLRLGGVALV
jgi:hypothetical protein